MTTKAKPVRKRQPKPTPPKPKKRRGRPTSWSKTPELQNKIISLIETDHSFTDIAKMKGMPSMASLIRWQSEDLEFEQLVVRAREKGQAEAVFSAMIDLERKLEKGEIDPQSAWAIMRSKQWRAGKLNQKRYGDKTQINATVQHSWADFVEEVAAKRLAEAKVIEGEIVDDAVDKDGGGR